MPTEVRRREEDWRSLALGARRIPLDPEEDPITGFLSRAIGMDQPSLLDRMIKQTGMQEQRLARGEYGPPPVDSPEFAASADVASNFDFTGALGGSVRNALGGEVLRDLGEMSGPSMTGGGGMSYGLTGGNMDRYVPPMQDLPFASPEGVLAPRVDVPLVEPGTYTGAVDPLNPKLWKSMQAKPGVPWEPGDLFDYEGLERVPPMPQERLPRMAQGPRFKEFPEYLTKIGNPDNMREVNDIVRRGIRIGGREWYNTEPLRKAFQDELGDEEGNAAHQFFTYVMGATSPGSKVDQNIRAASYHFQRARSGVKTIVDPVNKRPFHDPVSGKDKLLNMYIPEIPEGYGHQYQENHVNNMLDLINEGRLNSIKNPKIAGFAAGLWGNQYPIAADMHNLRALGYTDAKGVSQDSPNALHYAWLEDLQRQHAKEMGLTPAQYQASMWLAGADKTNMSSPVEPFLRTFERHVEYTAKQRNTTKAKVLEDFIHGRGALLSVGPMTGMLFRALLPEDVEVDDGVDDKPGPRTGKPPPRPPWDGA